MKKIIKLDANARLAQLTPSYWEKEVKQLPCKPLTTNEEVDIAIVGGGFVGLWTAVFTKQQQPDARIVIIERDHCGGGASGRNGGFAMSWWPKIISLINICGEEKGLALAKASEKAVSELGKFCQTHKIDAHFCQKGWLWTATTPAQQNAWENTLALTERLGCYPFTRLSNAEVAKRCGSNSHLSGVFEANNATIQPALLIAGLKRVAQTLGITIYEKTPVTGLTYESPTQLTTPDGCIMANRVVLATNVWATAIPELRKLIIPVNSAIVATEPMEAELTASGWVGGEAITDSQLLVGYYRTTQDKRIIYGKGTGNIAFGSQIDWRFSHDNISEKLAEKDFRRNYAHFSEQLIAHQWSGPIDRTYDSLPVFGHLKGAKHIVYGIGWSGNGVSPSQLGGKILSSLVLGLENSWTTCGLVNRSCRKFPPEPIRYWGGHLVRNAVIRKEAAESKQKCASSIDRWLAGFAPSGLEDKN